MKHAIDSTPAYLGIRWEAEKETDGTIVVKEASLCKFHRKEIALKFRAPGLRPAESCDFCQERSKKDRSLIPGVRGSGA